jgi:hypothetical protein
LAVTAARSPALTAVQQGNLLYRGNSFWFLGYFNMNMINPDFSANSEFFNCEDVINDNYWDYDELMGGYTNEENKEVEPLLNLTNYQYADNECGLTKEEFDEWEEDNGT